MALIGNSARAEFRPWLHALPGIKELRVVDTAPAATDKLLRRLLARTPGLEL